jgi:hypothetical protein
LLGSGFGHINPSEIQFILPNRHCVPDPFWTFLKIQKIRPFRNSNPSIVRSSASSTAWFSSWNLKLRRLVTYWLMVVAIIRAVLWTLHFQFWELCTLLSRVWMSLSSERYTGYQWGTIIKRMKERSEK